MAKDMRLHVTVHIEGGVCQDVEAKDGDGNPVEFLLDIQDEDGQESVASDATEKPSRTVAELAKEAIHVQDACNLSGVVHAFSRAVHDLRVACPGMGTDFYNRHPVCVLWADKIANLTGTQSLGVADSPDIVDEAMIQCWKIVGEKSGAAPVASDATATRRITVEATLAAYEKIGLCPTSNRWRASSHGDGVVTVSCCCPQFALWLAENDQEAATDTYATEKAEDWADETFGKDYAAAFRIGFDVGKPSNQNSYPSDLIRSLSRWVQGSEDGAVVRKAIDERGLLQ